MSIAHVLLLAPGGTAVADATAVSSVVSELAALAIQHGAGSVHAGTNSAPAQHAGGFADALVAVFPDHAALEGYLEDDRHHEVVGQMGTLGLRALVADLPPAHTPTPTGSQPQ